jgi:hypothetical protein
MRLAMQPPRLESTGGCSHYYCSLALRQQVAKDGISTPFVVHRPKGELEWCLCARAPGLGEDEDTEILRPSRHQQKALVLYVRPSYFWATGTKLPYSNSSPHLAGQLLELNLQILRNLLPLSSQLPHRKCDFLWICPVLDIWVAGDGRSEWKRRMGIGEWLMAMAQRNGVRPVAFVLAGAVAACSPPPLICIPCSRYGHVCVHLGFSASALFLDALPSEPNATADAVTA